MKWVEWNMVLRILAFYVQILQNAKHIWNSMCNKKQGHLFTLGEYYYISRARKTKCDFEM